MSQEDDGGRMPEDLEAVLEAAEEAEQAEEAEKGRYDAPLLPPALILGVVGLLCGFATIALVWLSERSCERFRGLTRLKSSGEGPSAPL